MCMFVVARWRGKQVTEVHYFTLMLEYLSLRAERTAGCVNSSVVLFILGLFSLVLLLFISLGKREFLLNQAAVTLSSDPPVISFYFCLNTHSGNPLRHRRDFCAQHQHSLASLTEVNKSVRSRISLG